MFICLIVFRELKESSVDKIFNIFKESSVDKIFLLLSSVLWSDLTVSLSLQGSCAKAFRRCREGRTGNNSLLNAMHQETQDDKDIWKWFTDEDTSQLTYLSKTEV